MTAISLDGFAALDSSELTKALVEDTGAALKGAQTFEMPRGSDWYAGEYEFQRPTVVVTNGAPGKASRQAAKLTIAFVTDGLEGALTQAKHTASNRRDSLASVVGLAQHLSRNWRVDELHIDLIPVLLGKAWRLFERQDDLEMQFEKTRAEEADACTYVVRADRVRPVMKRHTYPCLLDGRCQWRSPRHRPGKSASPAFIGDWRELPGT